MYADSRIHFEHNPPPPNTESKLRLTQVERMNGKTDFRIEFTIKCLAWKCFYAVN